jgi:hypothetical protein
MPTDDNVIKMPGRLARLAERAKKAAHACEEAGKATFAAIIEYGDALLEGRAEFPSDEQFGQWIAREGLGQIKPFDQQQERTAAMQIAELSSQGSVPWDGCPHQRPTNIMSWWRARQKPIELQSYGGPKREKAVDAILAYEAEHGELPTAIWGGTVPGVTPSTYYHTLREIKSIRAHGDTAWPLRFTKAQEHHIEALVKLKTKELESNFEDRVVEETKKRIDILFPKLEKLEESAKTNEKYYRERLESLAIFSEAEYRDILLCTHEANPSKETRERAFIALNAKKLQLTGKL